MARNKRATALFDVIHSAKKPPKASISASIPTPRWWGKNRTKSELTAVDKPEQVGRQQSWLAVAKRSGAVSPAAAVTPAADEAAISQDVLPAEHGVPEYEYEMPVEPVAQNPEVEVSPPPVSAKSKVRFADRFVNRKPKPVLEPESATETYPPLPEFTDTVDRGEIPEPEIKPGKSLSRLSADRTAALAVDRAAGDVRFRLSYGGLIAIGFILLMILAIAFIAGKQMAADSAMNDKPVQPSVTTAGLMAAVAPSRSVIDPPPINADVLNVATSKFKPLIAVAPVAVPATPALPIGATRDIGMIYIVIQSYADQETAQKACDFVNKAGVPCSMVQGLADWAPRDWYSVVGLQPFTRHDPSLAEHEKALTSLGLKFTNKIYNQFEPQAYTWRADSDG